MVTLTGVGGVGKTRLALQVAAEFADRFRHGTWFCDLAPVATPDGVVGAIADALGIDAGTVAPDESLVAWLRHHQALLVVDNCEHVLDESARIVEELVRGCAEVSVLATSREGLGAPASRSWPCGRWVSPPTVRPRGDGRGRVGAAVPRPRPVGTRRPPARRPHDRRDR